jgi:hypothetical protein
MKSFVMSDIQKLAFDSANGITREGTSKEQLNSAVKNAIVDACGGSWNYYNFMENRYKVFAILAEIMPVAMHANLAGKFEEFAQFHDENLGDTTYFTVDDPSTFPVVTIARGNQDIDRNRIIDKNFNIPTVAKGIKFFDELENLISGKIDFAKLSEKASDAMANYVGQLIADTILGSYSAVGSSYKVTGSWDSTSFNNIIEHVKAANNSDAVQVFGTSTALSNITDAFGYSDNAKDQANSWGYYGQFRGSKLIALPQAYRASTTSFAVDTNHLIILPVGNAKEKIVKVLFEGAPIVNMTDAMTRNDMQTEIMFQRRIGAGAITVVEGKYGFYKFQ